MSNIISPLCVLGTPRDPQFPSQFDFQANRFGAGVVGLKMTQERVPPARQLVGTTTTVLPTNMKDLVGNCRKAENKARNP